jgi:hypothetical protein
MMRRSHLLCMLRAIRSFPKRDVFTDTFGSDPWEEVRGKPFTPTPCWKKGMLER